MLANELMTRVLTWSSVYPAATRPDMLKLTYEALGACVRVVVDVFVVLVVMVLWLVVVVVFVEGGPAVVVV